MDRRRPTYLPEFLARSRALQALLGLLLAALLACAGAKTAGVVSASAATTPSTTPNQYNTPQYDNPQCVPTDQGTYQINGDGQLVNTTNPNWSVACGWTVPHDPNNPSVFDNGGHMTWQGCQYWAVEKRPDFYTNVIAPSGDWDPHDWVALAQKAGYSVSGTPAVGDLAIWPADYEGTAADHAAYVTAVNSDGSIVISEMGDGTTESQTMTGDDKVLINSDWTPLAFIAPPGGTVTPLPPTGSITTGGGGTGKTTTPGSSTNPGSSSKPQRKSRATVRHQLKRGTLTVRVRESGLVSVSGKAVRTHWKTRKLRFSHKRGSSLMTLHAKLPHGTWKITVSFKHSKGWTAVKTRTFRVRVTG